MRRLLSATLGGLALACETDWDCSLNGVCGADGACACDAPWGGPACGRLLFAPGAVTACGAECAYHGPNVTSVATTTWGASVLRAREDGRHYMWVAELVNECDLGYWRTNSEVALAVADDPLGPFAKLDDLVPPWAHNPAAIRAPDAEHGGAYVVYALGDGRPVSGPPADCRGGADDPAARARASARAPAARAPAAPTAANITATFTLHWATAAAGPYQAVNATILEYPAGWDYGAHGNWNPAPYVHPNGTVYLMVHPASGEQALLRADGGWRGPYRVVAASAWPGWGGDTTGTEDPCLWVDARGRWHALFHWINHDCGGHAWSADGLAWSDVASAFDGPRPVVGADGAVYNVTYVSERPKLLFADDGATPTHLYAGSSKGDPFTIVSPLALS